MAAIVRNYDTVLMVLRRLVDTETKYEAAVEYIRNMEVNEPKPDEAGEGGD